MIHKKAIFDSEKRVWRIRDFLKIPKKCVIMSSVHVL